MPKAYLECVKSEIKKGHSKKDAQRICAIWYYKKFSRTPQQDEGKASIIFDKHEKNLFYVLNTLKTWLNLKK